MHQVPNPGVVNADQPIGGSIAWFVVLSAAMFFFYEFIQQNMFDAISDSLLHAFSIDAEALGYLSSAYFWANVIFLFPAGMLLDRCATRNVILVSLGVCVLGTLGLALSTNMYTAFLARFLTGIGSAFCFLSVIRLASRWFPPRRMALVTGLVVTMAMAGGMISQAPMTLLVEHISWRHALFYDATLGVLVFVLIWFVVHDFPPGHQAEHDLEQQVIHKIGFWKSIRLAFLRTQNWLAGIYTCMMNLPLGVLGGLWGILYLQSADALPKSYASWVTSMLFLGTIFGSPLAGWLSDRMGKRRPMMLVGSVLALIIIALILLLEHLGFYPLLFLFFLLGLVTSSQIISYALVAESSPRYITAMSVSVVNISVQGGSAIFQPFFGYLMDESQLHRIHHLISHYIRADFHWAVLLFPVGFCLALLAALMVRETFCRAQ